MLCKFDRILQYLLLLHASIMSSTKGAGRRNPPSLILRHEGAVNIPKPYRICMTDLGVCIYCQFSFILLILLPSYTQAQACFKGNLKGNVKGHLKGNLNGTLKGKLNGNVKGKFKRKFKWRFKGTFKRNFKGILKGI